MSTRCPAVVTVDVWGVSAANVASALTAMARDRFNLRRASGLSFAKLLGTGSGETFAVTDVDLRHWAVLTCWRQLADAEAFRHSALVRRWESRSDELLHVKLIPLSSQGRWSRKQPFGEPRSTRSTGPVAAITRARLRPSRAREFWRAAPPVAKALHASDGLVLAIGVGEAPLGLQGTLSLWRDGAALRQFAYDNETHAQAIRSTQQRQWYSEELFARFAVARAHGRYNGEDFSLARTDDS